ncbi:hypothetical protein M8312_01530 [Sphingomonas sp. KRR8]|uniref:hypothetical protein n=1 Tax=Sphingomonas sp. KRR8 TaxID=2942996 RepID=UPI002021BBB2|nr:hypothetical protein [Sphingomonas sp. KRR8]URD61221.1 hypothetical protein M8312_01530 [Sphingomonas sp. KRR8]
MHKLVTLAVMTALTAGMSSAAFAGEVTGRHIRTAAPLHSNSICSYSGLEDGTTLVGFDELGNPIFVFDTPYGPGIVQTPHSDGGITHPPGIPGSSCHGGSNPENPPL